MVCSFFSLAEQVSSSSHFPSLPLPSSLHSLDAEPMKLSYLSASLSAGFMIGVDIYDAILVIRTQKALESFSTHKATLGTDIAVAAGPYGAGAAAE